MPFPRVPAKLPAEVPEVPQAVVARADLLEAIKTRLLAGTSEVRTKGGRASVSRGSSESRSSTTASMAEFEIPMGGDAPGSLPSPQSRFRRDPDPAMNQR